MNAQTDYYVQVQMDEDDYYARQALEASLAAERRDARIAAIADAVAAFSDLTPLLDAAPEMCGFCGVRAAEPGSDYCGLICAIDAEEN